MLVVAALSQYLACAFRLPDVIGRYNKRHVPSDDYVNERPIIGILTQVSSAPDCWALAPLQQPFAAMHRTLRHNAAHGIPACTTLVQQQQQQQQQQRRFCSARPDADQAKHSQVVVLTSP
jgi:hypothetical protein